MARAIPRSELTVFSKSNWPPPDSFNYQSGAALLIQKPKGWSSFRVVKVLRALLKVKKVGHAGTLDPAAKGLLIVCCGRATKTISQFQDLPKEYLAEIKFGESTPSFDCETPVEDVAEWSHITEKQIEEVLNSEFSGTILQTPPVYSAIKKNGERLYKKARRGEKVNVGQRWVTIHETHIEQFKAPVLHLKVICSKGTYIRSIANDLGESLNSLAYLTNLKRTAIGGYKNCEALTVRTLQRMDQHNG